MIFKYDSELHFKANFLRFKVRKDIWSLHPSWFANFPMRSACPRASNCATIIIIFNILHIFMYLINSMSNFDGNSKN